MIGGGQRSGGYGVERGEKDPSTSCVVGSVSYLGEIYSLFSAGQALDGARGQCQMLPSRSRKCTEGKTPAEEFPCRARFYVNSTASRPRTDSVFVSWK